MLSELTAEPIDLGNVVVRLLEKKQVDRFGFADEVATLLGEISGESAARGDLPPPRPYLYRPRLVGRDEVIHRHAAG